MAQREEEWAMALAAERAEHREVLRKERCAGAGLVPPASVGAAARAKRKP